MAEQWRLHQGYVVGCAIGTKITLQREGGDIRLFRPPVGLVLRLQAASTQQESSGDHLRLINPDESIDITLTRVGPPDDQVESMPAAEPVRPRDWPLALRRFALGAIVVGAAAYLLFIAYVVYNDLPDAYDAVVTPADTDLLGNVLLTFNVLLVGLVILSFGVGWRLRGFGVIGAALGAAVGGFLGSYGGDQAALMLNSHAFPLAEAGGGLAGLAVALLWVAMIPAVLLIGLVGWAIGAAVRRRRMRLGST